MAAFELISTVLTPATSYDLVKRADVKIELAITGNDENAWIDAAITRCSKAVANYCNRVLVVETVQDEFWPRRDPVPRLMKGGLDPLQLSRYPAVSVSSVVENAVTLVDGTDFRSNLDKGQMIRLNADTGYPKSWPAFPIVVQYVAGFSSIPDDIVDATIRLIKARRDARNRDPYLKEQNIPGVIEQQWWVASPGETGNMPPDVTDLLDNYRVPVTA